MIGGKNMKTQDKKKLLITFLYLSSFLVILFCFVTSYSDFAYAGERLAVSVSIANIRSGPGTNYDTLWQVNKYYPISVIKKVGSWLKFVDFEGDKGWIKNTLVRKIPTVITIKEDCNIRSGPGTKYQIVFKAERGVAFKVIKEEGRWIHVRHADGDKGWIYKPLVW
jgi:SH3-like domain-containing protein